MISWKADKKWSDKFLKEVQGIIGSVLIGEASIEEDQKHNTDLVVLKMDTVRIACRIRRHSYLERFGNEFTIRNDRPSGNTSEIDKIAEGWGDYLFYGFCDERECKLALWTIANLNVFRSYCHEYLKAHSGNMPGIVKPNPDGSSTFRVFKWSDLPHDFIAEASDQ